MDESYYSHRKTNLTFIFLIAISVFMMTARVSEYVRTVKTLLYYVLIPIPTVSQKIVNTNTRIANNIKELIHVHQENKALRQKLVHYALLDIEWKNMKEENDRLKNLLNLPLARGFQRVVARVISHEPGSWFQWVIINKGRNHGLSLDAPVLVWESNAFCVAGRVSELYDESAKVILITNALSALPAMMGTTRADGLLEGQNARSVKLNYILSKSEIAVGADVVTNPLSTVFPPNIIIGKIHDITISDDERFFSALVKPAVRINTLREVVVLVHERKND